MGNESNLCFIKVGKELTRIFVNERTTFFNPVTNIINNISGTIKYMPCLWRLKSKVRILSFSH